MIFAQILPVLVVASLMLQVYCSLSAQQDEHTHVRRLGLFHLGGGFPGNLQWLLCHGRRYRSRHCSYILSL